MVSKKGYHALFPTSKIVHMTPMGEQNHNHIFVSFRYFAVMEFSESNRFFVSDLNISQLSITFQYFAWFEAFPFVFFFFILNRTFEFVTNPASITSMQEAISEARLCHQVGLMATFSSLGWLAIFKVLEKAAQEPALFTHPN